MTLSAIVRSCLDHEDTDMTQSIPGGACFFVLDCPPILKRLSVVYMDNGQWWTMRKYMFVNLMGYIVRVVMV